MVVLQGVRSRFAVAMAAFVSAIFVGAALMSGPAWADGSQKPMSAAETQKAKGVTQVIPLGSGGLNLELRKGYAFIPAADVPPILQKLGAAAPTGTILGAVTANGANLSAKAYWISVITEDAIGHVPETGAAEIASVSFLDSVKAARPADPKLDSFAVTPAYAGATKTLIWAEKYQTKTSPTLKHEQRLLGRDSVAGVTTYGQSAALKKVSKAAGDVMSMISFTAGRTYNDFVAATDRASEYDLPGLITGKRKAGPLVETSDAGGAPASASGMSFADFAPGGKMQWAPWALGGIVALGGLYLVFSALQRRSRHEDEVPADDNPNTV